MKTHRQMIRWPARPIWSGRTVWPMPFRCSESRQLCFCSARRGKQTKISLEVRPFFEAGTGVIKRELLEPGELTQSLCSPWQNDYRECSCYYWAASRPDYVNIEARMTARAPDTIGCSGIEMPRQIRSTSWMTLRISVLSRTSSCSRTGSICLSSRSADTTRSSGLTEGRKRC